MRRKLFTVTDCFKIAGRGTAIVSNRPPALPEFEIENPIVLVLPDGQEFLSKISGIEMPITVSGTHKIAILVENLTKDEILIGTEVFLES